MSTPRKTHVGKSPLEKERYRQFLDNPRVIDPTFKEKETLSTSSVLEENVESTSIAKNELRPYKREFVINWRDLIVGLIILIFTLFAINLNREVGVLDERTSKINEDLNNIKEEVKQTINKINNLIIDTEVLKRTKK